MDPYWIEFKVSTIIDSIIILEETRMNKDQVKGAAKEIAGKVQEEAGKVVGSKSQQAKGLEKQVEGTAEKKIGDVKQVVKHGR